LIVMPSRKSAHSHAHAHAHPHGHAFAGRHVDLDGGDAFVPDYRRGFSALSDGDAEAFGEEFIATATSAEAVAESARDELLADELDGLSVEVVEEGVE
jgi:hypothetical protein